MRNRRIPEATVARLPRYLRALAATGDRGVTTISSEELAVTAGVNSAKLRKDLSHLGSFGKRGVGYEVDELVDAISDALGLTGERPLVIVGVGNLGRALASYGGFEQRGFRIVGLIDADPDIVGREVGGRRVEPLERLRAIVTRRHVTIAVLATPAAAAQSSAERLVGCGVTAILNFAPSALDVPDHVTVRHVDVSTELQILSFYERMQAGTGPGRPAEAPGRARRAAG